MKELMEEYLAIKTQIDALKIRQDDIAARLAAMAEYKDGSKTAHLYAGNLHFTVAKKENATWDQALLEAARHKAAMTIKPGKAQITAEAAK